MTYGLITFHNTHSAMETRNYLQPLFSIVIMPVLREISSSCGIGIRFHMEDLFKIKEALLHSSLSCDLYRMYRIGETNIEQITLIDREIEGHL